jgi:hypothetical protein
MIDPEANQCLAQTNVQLSRFQQDAIELPLLARKRIRSPSLGPLLAHSGPTSTVR